MYKIIDGRKIADKIKDDLVQEIFSYKDRRPSLAIILVGSREDSKLYVSLKEEEAKRVGVDTHLYTFPEETKSEDVLEAISFLNQDDGVDAILIQLPLPKHLNTDEIINALNPEKDADGFHPRKPSHIKPPVLSAITACLESIPLEGKGKSACILNKSEIFGVSVQQLLEERKFEIIGVDDIKKADLIITATGRPASVKADMMKKGVAIIDIGISKNKNKVSGDVDTESAREYASYLTPVPGGVGPMTIAFLFKNVLQIFKSKENKTNSLNGR